MALPVSRLVRVSINLSPLAAARRSFGVLMVATDDDALNPLQRTIAFGSFEEVADYFGTSSPVTLAAELYFGQTPQPRQMMAGRWVSTASSAINIGSSLSVAQQALANWTVITNGSFQILVDGTTRTASSLNFSSSTNLNGVASVIQSAISTYATVVWDGSKFSVTSLTGGAGGFASGNFTFTGNPSYGSKGSSTITLTGNPTAADTVTIQGTVITFVSGTPSGNQVQIGGTNIVTSANLQAFLAGSPDANISLMTYNTISNVTTISSRIYGTAANAYTLAKSSTNITISGATFTGGVNPDTITFDGTAFTFVQAYTTGNQILVGATKEDTAANALGILNASADSNVNLAAYSVSSNIINIAYKTIGTAGNSYTLAFTGSSITRSATTLLGGSAESSVGYAVTGGGGTDISTMLRLTSATNATLVPGYDAETPVECVAVLANASSLWYGLDFAATQQVTDDDNIEICSFIEALDLHRMFGVTVTDTEVLNPLSSTDVAARMKAGAYLHSMCQYSQNAYAISSYFGRMFSVNFNANRSTITLMYKQEPGVVAENLTTQQANTLQDKRCNVFVNYVNDTTIIQYGVMSGPAYSDEIHGLDWLQDAVQNACYNLMYTSPTKIPQTDSGANQFVTTIAGVMDQAVNNGLVGPGVWTGSPFGQLSTGDFLKNGYYIYAEPLALQSDADRQARIAPPITIAIKLAGAIQEVDVIINVNR